MWCVDLEDVAGDGVDEAVNTLDDRVDTSGEVTLDVADERTSKTVNGGADAANETARGQAVNGTADTTEAGTELVVEDGRALDNTANDAVDANTANEVADSCGNATLGNTADD